MRMMRTRICSIKYRSSGNRIGAKIERESDDFVRLFLFRIKLQHSQTLQRTMKISFRAFLMPILAGFCSTLMAQDYTMTLEEHATDIIDGQTTYRLYMNMVNTDDFLTSVFGGDTDPLTITTSTGSFYNDPFGASLASSINPLFLTVFPTIAGDSWITIGLENENVGEEVAISTVEDPAQPFVACFASGSDIDGQDISIDSPTGGAWFVLNGTPNGLPDENMRVLVLQMTTSGEICGTMNFQIFENGDGQNGDMRLTFTFCGVGTYNPVLEGSGCTDPTACNYDAEATEDDGSCDFSCQGCTDTFACNYDMDATEDDGSCNYTSCLGCTDGSACNFDPDAIYDDGSCDYSCTAGCTNDAACNYDPAALEDDGSCEYSSCYGCTDMDACNYDPIYTIDNGSCDYSCIGCTDMSACNYSPSATEDDGSCEFAEEFYNCGGVCLNDVDGDGICDELEVPGCTEESACNYNDEATDDDGMCTYAEAYYDCAGNCLMDMDGDGVCDELEVEGCDDEAACNYNEEATNNDGSCEFPAVGYDCDGNCLADTDGDGICDPFEVAGCTDATACNYEAAATDDDGMCEYADDYYDCEGNCLNDADGDGICDELEIAGCTDSEAENYNEEATDDDGSCYYCDIALTGDATNETEGDATGTISVDVTGGTAPYEFAWSGPDAFTSADEDLTGLSEGTYSLTVTDANGCTETLEVTVDNVTGIGELSALEFDVYPNPTQGFFWVEGSNLSGKAAIDVLDASGRLISRTELTFNGQPVQLGLDGVETGYYHVVIHNGQVAGTKQLLVH